MMHENSVSWPACVRATQVTQARRPENFTEFFFDDFGKFQLGGPQSRAMTTERLISPDCKRL